MVRNVDLPEAVIMYGRETIMKDYEIRPGLKPLLEECRDEGTAVVLIDDSQKNSPSDNDGADTMNSVPSDIKDLIGFTYKENNDYYPPNPRSLYEVIESVTIQPRGFGGSSGFGRAVAESERNPLPKHVVVFGCNVDICRAARYMGMRCMSFQDNDLADAIIDDYNGIWLDEIATPGSFWLNPPHPKDDEGNKVDPLEIIEWYETEGTAEEQQQVQQPQQQQLEEESPAEEEMSDEEMKRILADLDSL